MAEDGVTPFSLLADLKEFIDEDHPIAKAVRPSPARCWSSCSTSRCIRWCS